MTLRQSSSVSMAMLPRQMPSPLSASEIWGFSMTVDTQTVREHGQSSACHERGHAEAGAPAGTGSPTGSHRTLDICQAFEFRGA